MKITFVVPFASLGGGIRVIATYARTLHARGHEITVVSQPHIGMPMGRKTRLKAFLGLYTPSPPPAMTPLLDFLGERHIILDTPRPVEARDLPDADIIVASWWETAAWIGNLPSSKGRRFHLLQDYEMFENVPQEAAAATYHLGHRQIAVSDYIRREVETNHGVAGIGVIRNSVDLEQFTTPPRDKNKTLTIGLTYSTTPRKNVSLAIEAINIAKTRLPHLKGIAFGAHEQFSGMALPDWVTYHQAPTQTDIPKLYAACDAWLFTSEKEGFGLPILEAMACRTPVLATPAGAAPELVNDRNGALLEPSVDAFVDRLIEYDQMPSEDWRAKSDAAFQTPASYTWEDATDLLIAAFEAK